MVSELSFVIITVCSAWETKNPFLSESTLYSVNFPERINSIKPNHPFGNLLKICSFENGRVLHSLAT